MNAFLKWTIGLAVLMLGINYFVEPPLSNMHRSYLAAKKSRSAALRLDTLRQTDGNIRFLAELLLGNPLVPDALTSLSASLAERHPKVAAYLADLPIHQDSLRRLLQLDRDLERKLEACQNMDAEALRHYLTSNPQRLQEGLDLSIELSRTPGSLDRITTTLLDGLHTKQALAQDLQRISKLGQPTEKNTAALHRRALLCILFAVAGSLLITSLE